MDAAPPGARHYLLRFFFNRALGSSLAVTAVLFALYAALRKHLFRRQLTDPKRLDPASRTNSSSSGDEQLDHLTEELQALRLRELKRRALAEGIGDEAVEAAYDSDDPKETLVAALLAEAERKQLRGAQQQQPADAVGRERLVAELVPLKVSALKKRAVDVGLDSALLEHAFDEDSPKDAIIALLVEHVLATATSNSRGVGQAAQKEALQAELAPLKLSLLRNRAVAAGASEAQLDAADDSDDVKAAMVELVVQNELKAVANDSARPHFGAISGAGPSLSLAELSADDSGPHVMLSYQWDIQEQVVAVRQRLMKKNIKTWMDIDGGMRRNLYDSMAEGVTNAGCVVCFMTRAYENSENCRLVSPHLDGRPQPKLFGIARALWRCFVSCAECLLAG